MFIILFLSLWPQRTFEFNLKDEFIVWNVGQGQWTTWIHDFTCHHFDIGGEFNPNKAVLKKCLKLKNEIYISHWDKDHWSFLRSYIRSLEQICIHPTFFGEPPSQLLKTLENLKTCTALNSQVELIFSGRQKKQKTEIKSRNPNSQVFLIKPARILIPGDSTKAEEKIWIPRVRPLNLNGWVLGHHGSFSSTAEKSLSHFSKISWVLASSRFKKYKHPHKKVTQLLKRKRIPLLKTEDWGHLHFLL